MEPVQSTSTVQKTTRWPVSRNLQQLQRLVMRINLLHCNKYWIGSPGAPKYPTKLLQTMCLLTLHWQMQEKSACLRNWYPAQDFLRSQKIVYEHPRTTDLFPNRTNFEPNLELAVHIGSFFKYYLAVVRTSGNYLLLCVKCKKVLECFQAILFRYTNSP